MLYTISGDVNEGWYEATKLGSGEQVRDAFAKTVAIDGDIAVVGVTGADFGTGTVTIYKRNEGQWEIEESIMGDREGFDAVIGGQIDCTTGVAYAFDCEDYDLLSLMPVKDMAPRELL